MLKTAREKIALAVFVLLLLGGLGLCIAYISGVGHNLNVAASTIDDVAGELDGYSAFVYKGTALPTQESTADQSASSALNQKAQSDGVEPQTDETAAKQLDDEQRQDGQVHEEVSEPLTLATLRTSYLDKGASCYELTVDNPHAYDAYTVVRVGKFSFGLLSLHEDDTPEAVLARVVEYKQADVDFIVAITPSLELVQSLDEQARGKQEAAEAAEAAKLAETSERKTGQDSTAQTTLDQSSSSSQSSIQGGDNDAPEQDKQQGEQLAKQQTDRQTKEQFFSVTDFSIVISSQDEGLLPGGVMVDGVYYDDAALTTELGTLLISPSKVITARDIAID